MKCFLQPSDSCFTHYCVENSYFIQDSSAGNPAPKTCLTKPPESFGLKSNFIKSCSVQSKRVIDAKMELFLENALP